MTRSKAFSKLALPATKRRTAGIKQVRTKLSSKLYPLGWPLPQERNYLHFCLTKICKLTSALQCYKTTQLLESPAGPAQKAHSAISLACLQILEKFSAALIHFYLASFPYCDIFNEFNVYFFKIVSNLNLYGKEVKNRNREIIDGYNPLTVSTFKI